MVTLQKLMNEKIGKIVVKDNLSALSVVEKTKHFTVACWLTAISHLKVNQRRTPRWVDVSEDKGL